MSHASRAWQDSEVYARLAEEARRSGDTASADQYDKEREDCEKAAAKFSSWRRRGAR